MTHDQRTPVALFRLVAHFAFVLLLTATGAAQSITSDSYAAMRWRLVGPFRAGRVTAVAGIAGQPTIYYMGTPGGGVWKTNDGGQVWKPIFDEEHDSSVGALAVAASNPNIIYVGTGEQIRGKGMYRSADAGVTWTKIGLGDMRYIDAIVVDPHNPDIVLVAAGGDYPPNPMGGIFKTTDAGKTWRKVLSREEATGGIDLSFNPDNPAEVFAALCHRNPDSFDQPTSPKPDGWLYRSTDEGSSWELAQGKGWPSGSVGRIGVAVAPGTQGRRVYAIVSEGLLRSDDAGANWQRITTDPRIVGSSYFSRVFVDPKNADIVYLAQTSLYRSVDGGKTFDAFAGAPSGDDFHVLWINPDDSRQMIAGVDQGAIVSVNGGESWSSWYNQATGQLYNVSADNQFPYHLYAAQQDSGTVAVPSRGDYGEITYRDWFSPGGFEIGSIVADPANSNVAYAAGWYNTVIRFDKTTGQVVHVFVLGSKDRASMVMPMAFSPQDPRMLYLGTQSLLKTTDNGMTWQAISPDLSRGAAKETEKVQSFTASKHAISTLSPSPLQPGQIWVATDDGLVQLTQNGGKTWSNVSPTGVTPQSTFVMIEASHHDRGAAYAVVNGFHDSRPYAYRTHDYGRSWQKIVAGLPESSVVRVVREDPVRKGLLYAGTEDGVSVSFDDGDHWQPLQLNLPTTSVRDLVVHKDDLAAATFGRGLWILDDLTPLRQMDPGAKPDVHFFRPANAIRVRWDVNQDTPLPAETPAGQNPPDGAIFDYFLKAQPSSQITLAIYDQQKTLMRQFSSAPQPAPVGFPNVPDYWFAPPPTLTKNAGHNRFVWDLRYDAPQTLPYGYFGGRLDYVEYTLAEHAIPGQTPRIQPPGPLVVPGEYQIALTVDGKTYNQPLIVTLDPRAHAGQADLVHQLELEKAISSWMSLSYAAHNQVSQLQSMLTDRQKALSTDSTSSDALTAVKALDTDLEKLEGGTSAEPGLGLVNRDLARLLTMAGSGDAAPSNAITAAAQQQCEALRKDLTRWKEINDSTIPALNKLLRNHNVNALPQTSDFPIPQCTL